MENKYEILLKQSFNLNEKKPLLMEKKYPKTFKELFEGTGIEPTTDEEGNTHYNFKAKRITECAEETGWCDKLVEDVANYYKNLLKIAAKELDIYYESLQKSIEFDFKEHEGLARFIHRLKSESYGAK